MSYISRCSICCILLISDRRLLSSSLHLPSVSHPRKPKPHVLPGEELPGSLPLPAASSGPAWGTGPGGIPLCSSAALHALFQPGGHCRSIAPSQEESSRGRRARSIPGMRQDPPAGPCPAAASGQRQVAQQPAASSHSTGRPAPRLPNALVHTS